MRIAIISRELGPFRIGGTGAYAAHLAMALAGRGHQVHVVTENWLRQDAARTCEGRVHVHRLSARPETPLSLLGFAARAGQVVIDLHERIGLDVVECPDTGALALPLVAAGRMGVQVPPVVVSIEAAGASSSGTGTEGGSTREWDDILMACERGAAQLADAVVCDSRACGEWAARRYGLDVDAMQMQRPLCWEHRCGSVRERVVLHEGPLEAGRGLEDLIGGWLRARPFRRGWRLLLAGADAMTMPGGTSIRARLAAMAGDDQGVVCVSVASAAARRALHESAAMVVSASPGPGLEYEAAEAMAGGRVALAIAGGGVAGLLPPTLASDWEVAAPGCDAWAAALDRATRHDLGKLSDLGSACSRHVLRLCDPVATAASRERLYQRLEQRAAASTDCWKALRGSHATVVTGGGAGAQGAAAAGAAVPGGGAARALARVGLARAGAAGSREADAMGGILDGSGNADGDAVFRIIVGTDDPAVGPVHLHLRCVEDSPWSAFLGGWSMPDADALDELAEAIRRLAGPPRSVELIGSPSACLLPLVWLRTIWLEASAVVTLRWPRVAHPAPGGREQAAGCLCLSLVDAVRAVDRESAAGLWGWDPRRPADAGAGACGLFAGLIDLWETQVAGSAVPAAGPALVRMAMARLVSAGRRRVALYGAGTHTRSLGEALAQPEAELVCIIDDDERRHGERLWGYPIVSQQRAIELGIDAAILSASSYEQALWERSAGLREAGVEVVRLYGGQGAAA